MPNTVLPTWQASSKTKLASLEASVTHTHTLGRISYINSRGHATIQLHTVCTPETALLSVHSSWPGSERSASPARVSQKHPLCTHLQDVMRSQVTTTCLETLHTPCAHHSPHHTEIMGTYPTGRRNTLHSSTWVVIERAAQGEMEKDSSTRRQKTCSNHSCMSSAQCPPDGRGTWTTLKKR